MLNDNNLECIHLVQYSGDVGCVNDSKDYLLNLDIPTSETFIPSTKIPTQEAISALLLQYEKYLNMVSIVHELAEEITKYANFINVDMVRINEKYSNTKHLKVKYVIDQTMIVKTVKTFISYLSSHAVLYAMDKEKFMEMNIDLKIIYDYYKKINPEDGNLIITPDNYRVFGEESRAGESIFDRVAYHYPILLKRLGATSGYE